jgi:hypothetical protein
MTAPFAMPRMRFEEPGGWAGLPGIERREPFPYTS